MENRFCQLEGLLAFSDQEHFDKAVKVLEQNGLSKGTSLINPDTDETLFSYAINPDLKFIALPLMPHCQLLEFRAEVFEQVSSAQTHFKSLVVEEDVQIIIWNNHTSELIELAGAEIASLFIDENEKLFFEVDYHLAETDLTEEQFLQNRLELSKQAFEKIDGILEMQAINDYLSQVPHKKTDR